MRRTLIAVALFGLILTACAVSVDTGGEGASYEEQDVATLQQAMESGELTAVELVDYYLDRIETLLATDPIHEGDPHDLVVEVDIHIE